jgi:signal transduction histidine kinase
MHPEDASHTAAALQRALTEPGLPVSVEYRFRHRDGTWHVLQSIGKSIPNQTSEGFIVINSRDITENRKLEEQFRQSQKMEAIGHLAGGVAHDFNNILAVIQMQAGLLEAAGSLLPTQRNYCKEIGKAVQRAANLTRQLLLFSRRQALQPHDLNLNDVIINITKMLQRILGEDVRLQFNYSPAPLLITRTPG